MLKRLPCGCEVEILEGSMFCAACKAKRGRYEVIPARITGFPPGGFQVTDGLQDYGWFSTEEEAQRFADGKNVHPVPGTEALIPPS